MAGATCLTHPRAAFGLDTFDVDQIFDGDRNAVQRSPVLAALQLVLGALSGFKRLFAKHFDPGVQLRFERFDPAQGRLDDVNRREFAEAHHPHRLPDRKLARIGGERGVAHSPASLSIAQRASQRSSGMTPSRSRWARRASSW